MSAIVAAASARSWHVKILRQVGRTIGGPTGAHMLASADYHEQRLAAAGRAIVDASNRACRAQVVRGAPRTWAIRWSLWRSGYWYARTSDWRIVGEGIAARGDLRPCWDAANRLWVWGTAAHDAPAPCAWPRPFARGADR